MTTNRTYNSGNRTYDSFIHTVKEYILRPAVEREALIPSMEVEPGFPCLRWPAGRRRKRERYYVDLRRAFASQFQLSRFMVKGLPKVRNAPDSGLYSASAGSLGRCVWVLLVRPQEK